VCGQDTAYTCTMYVHYLIPAVQADLTLTAGVGGDEARLLA
jgi:hypothetical protein